MQTNPSDSLDAIKSKEEENRATQVKDFLYSGRKKSEIMDRVKWETYINSQKDFVASYFRTVSPLSFFLPICLVLIYYSRDHFSMDSFYIVRNYLFKSIKNIYISSLDNPDLLCVIIVMLVCIVLFLIRDRQKSVYLIDFATYQPGDDLIIKREDFLKKSHDVKMFTQSSIDFQEKILATSDIGESTYFPPGIMSSPIDLSMQSARGEASLVMFGAIEDLFKKTGVNPKSINFVITNCSLFCPTPSLSAMIVNKYKMKNDVITYSLGGMGCSAGIIAIDLARRLLEHKRNATCLVVSTENITQNWYHGNDKSMLLSNCLFRCGAAAMLLSNKTSDKKRSVLQLKHSIRTHMGALDDCYECVYQCEDVDGKRGVRLSRQVMQVAGDALKNNITTLGPLVLPITEQLKFVLNFVMRKSLKGGFGKFLSSFATKVVSIPVLGSLIRHITSLPLDPSVALPGPAFVPDFKTAFDHFCIHAGGRAVLDAMEKNLSLPPESLAPSRYVLNRYGNTSSSSVWYELEYLRENGLLKKGQSIWQIAFGSGFKCNSGVWKVLKTVPATKKESK